MRDPRSALAYDVLVAAHLDRHEMGAARLLAMQAVKLDEKNAAARVRAGDVLLRAGDGSGAAAQWRAAIAADPGFVDAHFRLGVLALGDGDYARARKELEPVVAARPDDSKALMDLGIALRGSGDAAGALSAYERAAKAAPGWTDPLLGQAIILHRNQDKPEKALDLYRAYVSAHVDLPPDAPVLGWMKECEALAQAHQAAPAAKQEGGKP
jgi:tetratricopeptide (TPR) repeat protein